MTSTMSMMTSNYSYNSFQAEPVEKIEQVYTTARKIALTFNGLPSKDKLISVLGLLDKHHMKATFFVPGYRAAIEPDLVTMIVNRGHEVANNTLNKVNLDAFTYNEMVDDLGLSKQKIEAAAGVKVQYVRSETSHNEEAILKAAQATNHKRYIGYSLFLTDEYLHTIFHDKSDVRNYVKRGAIVAIDLERNERISQMLELLAEAAEEVHYSVVSVSNVMQDELDQKPAELINGYDLASLTQKTVQASSFTLMDHVRTDKKQIAITFDDWGTDYTITNILDILHEKHVQATFFVRADGAERNPSLARSILNEGHEVANHSYKHPVLTQISEQEILEDVVKAHQVLTWALQQAPTMYFRPPTGDISNQIAREILEVGYDTIINFNIDPQDWNRSSSTAHIVQTSVAEASNGGIILLHMLDGTHTVEALPILIDQLREKGYELVTISQLLQASYPS